MPAPSQDTLIAALSKVNDPEIRKPITELGMVESVNVDESGRAAVTILLTISGCPLKDTLTRDATAALLTVEGVTSVDVTLGVMSDEQRAELKTTLRGGNPEREIPFAQPSSLTRVYCVASGKGGVGKSSVTVNLAAAMAQDGLRVGVVDADVYGFSVPRMLGVEHRPTQVDDMILPPLAHDVKVISIGMFVPGNQPVVWRGPMLHRALQQFLGDVFWGDLDVLLLDLPPGTGDIAISVAQLIPSAEILVVTTPPEGRLRGGRTRRFHCAADTSANRWSHREHVVDGDAGRHPPRDLRGRRRPERRGLVDPRRGRAGSAAGSDPVGHPTARRRRQRHASRAG